MKTKSKDVKLKGEVVEVIDVPVYENVEEIADAMKADVIVDLINRQLLTDLANQARARHRESVPGKGKRYNEAFNVLPDVVFDDGESGTDKLVAATMKPENERKAALDALLQSAEVQKAVDASLGAAA